MGNNDKHIVYWEDIGKCVARFVCLMAVGFALFIIGAVIYGSGFDAGRDEAYSANEDRDSYFEAQGFSRGYKDGYEFGKNFNFIHCPNK